MTQIQSKPILIIQTAFIGDTILASSFAHSVHEKFPNAPLHFVLRKGNESVIQGLPFIEKVWIWDKSQGKVKSLIALIKALREIEFFAVLNIHRHFNSGLITALMKAKNKIGFKQNPLSFFYTKKINHQIPHVVSKRAWHEVQRNLQLLQALAPDFPMPMKTQGLNPHLPIEKKHEEKVSQYKIHPFVVVAPASVWFTKQWEESSYIELVRELSKNYQVLLIGGPGDKELCDKVKADTTAINLCGKLNLLESAALMKGAQRVFVNDSGPLHLASAVNAKTTTMFCATIPEFGYGPLADEAIVLESPEKLDCRPCGLHGHTSCPKGHFKCAKNITVDMALATLSQKH
ncbi:MAG: glycosyltransferase family 9 protein [Bacteriovoracaceae bacterium]|nr:glycosyltransferase family 9 protein [Bacteriovoracaceae bacterium]